jgi:hypothetical protein
MIKKLNVSVWRLIDKIRAVIEFECCLKALSSRRWFSFKRLQKGELFKLNSWIGYMPKHTQLRYKYAIELYNMLITLPVKFTRRRAKRVTKAIIDLSNRGYSLEVIKSAMMQVVKEYRV